MAIFFLSFFFGSVRDAAARAEMNVLGFFQLNSEMRHENDEMGYLLESYLDF